MKLTIRRPDDFHLHLRQGAMLSAVLPATARQFGRAIIMPNTDSPILTAADVERYRRQILAEDSGLTPLMTIKLVPATTPVGILEARAVGTIAGKLYPEGVTTNSDDGVRDIRGMYPVFDAMERSGMVLCLHGESPGAFCLDREKDFLRHLVDIAGTFQRLKIVLEHITTDEAVKMVSCLPGNVAATITVHHLYLTLDDVIGGLIRPHTFCKPIAKRPEDRTALIAAAVSGNPKFFLGTDSAPHLRERKECDGGCAGVFSAPMAMQALAWLFVEGCQAHDRLEKFTSRFGAEFYGLPLNEGKLELIREPKPVPREVAGVVPFMAGEIIPWSLR